MVEKNKEDLQQTDDGAARIEMELKAVIDGEIVPVEEIDDPVFSSRMIGDGYGIIPTGKKLYSPIAGRVEEIASTKHAIYLSADNNIKMLIHLGIDTIQLKGEGFETTLEKGTLVEVGDLLVSFDPDFIIEEGLNPIVSVIILDQKERKLDVQVYPEKQAKAKETLAANVTLN